MINLIVNKLQMALPLKMSEQSGSLESKANVKSFKDFLTDAVAEVNKLQQEAHKASIDLAAGKINDISEVVIATEKAAIALQLTLQVRNKAVDAYQEVMRMQV